MIELASKPPLENDSNDSVDKERIEQIVKKHKGNLGDLIAILEDVQLQFGYLPEEALRIVSTETGRSLVDIYGVAKFYHSFSLEPRGKHIVSVCQGTACHVRGSSLVVKEFENQLDANVGETTEDKEFTLKTVNCLGACALGPVAVIDGHYFSKLKRTDVKKLIQTTKEGLDKALDKDDQRIFHVKVSCPFCNHSLMDNGFSIEGHASIRVTVSFDDKHGWLRLSSLYGRYNVFSEHDIPFDKIMNYFCPHCHAELLGNWDCPMCSAPMVPMNVDGGGTVRICSRRGCTGTDGHMLDLR